MYKVAVCDDDAKVTEQVAAIIRECAPGSKKYQGGMNIQTDMGVFSVTLLFTKRDEG